jgi:hypothetical protein
MLRSEVALTLDLPVQAPRSKATALNLARPWRFPAGHPDSILCRRHPRSSVQVPVEITLCRADGSPYDKGTGVIRDLSYTGARLGDVFLSRGRLLATCFQVELWPALESRGGRDIAGRILRTYSEGYPGFGIEFLFPAAGAQERLRRMRGVRAADPDARDVGPLPEEPRRRGS